MNNLLAIIVLSAFINVPFAYSTDYYFSNTGSDELNTGTSLDSPYKTISKLNTLSLTEGDNIFFKRGDTFTGQINAIKSGTSNAYITFAAYGTGINPVITGASQIKNWQIYSGNIYVADVPEFSIPVNQLFVNNSLMTLARYPNSGFITIDSSLGKQGLSSDLLTQPDAYWNGANVISKTEKWIYENKVVANYKAGTLRVASPSEFTYKIGFGFFLNNKLSELDAPGEWFHDVQTKKIYLMLPSPGDANNLEIKASLYNYGININKQNYIIINNLSICCQGLDGIYINGCTNISITNNTFSYIFRNGIWAGYTGGTNIKITNNSIENTGNNGIDISNAAYSTIQGNKVNRISLIPGSGQGIGIHAGPNSHIAYNVLDSIGYNGIHLHNADTVVNNYVKNSCLTKDDGAGIYMYKSNGLVINNNIVINSIGNTDATPDKNFTSAHGIYLDDSSSYCSLSHNTIVNADYGIFIHNAFNNTINGNVSYNNRKAQLKIQSDHAVAESVDIKGNNISGNVFYSLNPNQLCMYLWSYKDNTATFATFDKNYYCNPYSDILIKTLSVPYYPSGTLQKSQTYRYEDWKKLIASDISSITSKVDFGALYNVDTISGNLISNPTFENDKKGWYKWGSSNYTLSLDSTNLLFTDNSLKSEFSDFTLNSKGYFANGNFTVTNGNYYRLKFKANSLKNSDLDFDITQNAYPYKTLGLDANFLIKKEADNFEYEFKSLKDFSNARIMFSTTVYDSTAWIDDVSIMEISVDTNTSMPCSNSPILINTTSATKNFKLPGLFKDLNGKTVRRYITMPAFSSKVFTNALYVSSLRTAASSIPLPVSEITIFPVPAQSGNTIYIQYPDYTEDIMADYSISDLSGREISKGSATFDDANQIEIVTTDLPKGFSIIKLTTGTSIKTAKIILF